MIPFQMAQKPLPSSIPLHCNICAKKPTFSDVSHLLTHIASKGHLSTYYKLKVRAGSEDASRRLIESYDGWYAMWRIEDLMSERMNVKDQKRRPRTARLPALDGLSLPPNPYFPLPAQFGRPSENVVDPRLFQQSIKAESLSRSATPLTDPTFNQPEHGHPFNTWHQNLTYSNMFSGGDAKDDDADTLSTASLPSLAPYTGYTTAGSITNAQPEGPPIDAVNDANKLKGVMWPGMDLFDAATPDARRKRNQKKSTSVVEQLEIMSQGIEATEMVFSSNGLLQKSRTITGFPNSDSSPLMGEELPPTKNNRRATRRIPLADKDPNAASRPRKKAKTEQLPYFVKHDEIDDTLHTRNRRREQADKPVKRHNGDEVSFEQPAVMDYLTSTYQPPSPSVRSPDDESNWSGLFRPSEGSSYTVAGYNNYQPQYMHGTTDWPQFSLETSILPAWDFLGQDLSGALSNPLYMEPDGLNVDLDDQTTISAPVSET